MTTPDLVVLPYLQYWSGPSDKKLSIRVLLIPRGPSGDPLRPLANTVPPAPNFATANLKFDVNLVPGLDQLPTRTSGTVLTTVSFDALASSLQIFNGIVAELSGKGLSIDSSSPGQVRDPGIPIRVHKYLPLTYQQAVGTVSGNEIFHTDDTYYCSLKQRTLPTKYVPLPAPSKQIAWGRLIAALLRYPKLAEAAGLIRSTDLTIALDLVKDGGYIFLTVAASSDVPTLVLKTYAARLPDLTSARDLFAPVFFPVADPPPAVPPRAPGAALFAEAEDYNDGWAKAVHCVQPQQLDPLKEQADGTRPPKELGIRLGWDDEQVTVWLDRQMDPSNIDLDSPLGVQGYRIDAQIDGTTIWNSLVAARGPNRVNGVDYGPDFDGELGVEIHPSQQVDAAAANRFWVPMYFTHWSGPSLVTKDVDRIRLAGNQNPTNPATDRPVGLAPAIALTYGTTYKFRVRLMDHTGGGPTGQSIPLNAALNPVSTIPFRRWIRPLAPVFISEIPILSEDPGSQSAPAGMEVKRPILHYPAVACTGRYPNVIGRLNDQLAAIQLISPVTDQYEPSLPDPDVDFIEIAVEVSTLTQDPLATDASYMVLYVTKRPMPAFDHVVDHSLVVDFSYNDVHDVWNPAELGPDGWNANAVSGPLLLPTARTIRLRVGALCSENLAYFGAKDVIRGPTIIVALRKNSSQETSLFQPESTSAQFNAYFLQPDLLDTSTLLAAQIAAGKQNERPADIASRLAAAVGVRNTGMTLRSRPGERIVFACSGAIRHTIGPDGASVTFTSQADLALHWILVIQLLLKRDWSWDGLAYNGISVTRDGTEITRFYPPHNVNSDALDGSNTQRSYTKVVIFDAIDPKPPVGQFPAELNPSYNVSWSAALYGSPTADSDLPLSITLPVTTQPTQTPRIVSAGLAMSAFTHSPEYSSTLERQKTLWVEFAEAPANPLDTYFCRVLRNAPDPLLTDSAAYGDLPVPPAIAEATEPALAIDPETTLRVLPGESNDRAGLSAMQPLLQSTTSDVHYALPLPPGLTAISPELFGFFTYEFRIGHADLILDPTTGTQKPTGLWSTAQGRYSAPLRCTGIQHPAPQLAVSASRTSDAILASAPLAIPVLDGVAVLPPTEPRTRIFIFLYAQVFQIDASRTKQRRNVLLLRQEALVERVLLELPRPFPPLSRGYKPFATASFPLLSGLTPPGVGDALGGLGLSSDTPLSVLAVEVLPLGTEKYIDGTVQGLVNDPLGSGLGGLRVLRTSCLTAVPSNC